MGTDCLSAYTGAECQGTCFQKYVNDDDYFKIISKAEIITGTISTNFRTNEAETQKKWNIRQINCNTDKVISLPRTICISWYQILIVHPLQSGMLSLDHSTHVHAHAHAHTHTTILRFYVLSGTTWVSRHQKGKTNLDLLEKEIASGSGMSWVICKSAPWPRHITTPASHHSVFYRTDALPAAQPTASKHWR